MLIQETPTKYGESPINRLETSSQKSWKEGVYWEAIREDNETLIKEYYTHL